MKNKPLLMLGLSLLLLSSSFVRSEIPAEVRSAKQPRTQKNYSPYPQPDAGYVTDYARLLTRQQAEKIEQLLWRTEEQTGLEIVVMTIDSLNDYPGTDNASIESFATGLFNCYGIGNMPANNGILLVVAYKDHRAKIELGKAYARGYDAAAARIMSNVIIPEFRKDRYDQGIIAGVDALVKEFSGKTTAALQQENPTATAENTPSFSNTPRETTWFDQVVFQGMRHPFILVGIILFLIMVAYSLFKNGKSGWGWVCVGIIFILVIFLIKVLFMILTSGKNHHGDSGGWSSGGFGGGFGGGSSGGGGASGSW